MSGTDRSETPRWPDRLASLVPAFTPGPPADSVTEAEHAGGGRVFDFHQMTPTTAARMVERIEARRGLTVDSAQVRTVSTPINGQAVPVAVVDVKPVSAVTGLGAPPVSREQQEQDNRDRLAEWNRMHANGQPQLPPATTAPTAPTAPSAAPTTTAPAAPTTAAPATTAPVTPPPTTTPPNPAQPAEAEQLPTRMDPETVRLTPLLQQFYNPDGTLKTPPKPAPESAQQAYDALPPQQRALVEQTMSGQFTFEQKPDHPSPANDPAPGPALGPRPAELVPTSDGSDALVIPVQGPNGLSRIVFGPDGSATVIDPDGTTTPVNSYGIAPPRRTHANQMFDPYTGRWIQPPPQTPKGLAPEIRQSPWREAIESVLSAPADPTTTRSPQVHQRGDGSTEVRILRGGSEGADRPWVEVRIINAEGHEIAHYREGSDGNKHYPLGAGHWLTVGPDGKIIPPRNVDRSPLDSLSVPDGQGKVGYIEHDGWTTALKPIPLPAGVPGQALYTHNGRLLIRDDNGKYHWVDATPETLPSTPAQRSIHIPWDSTGTNSYQGPDGTWYFNVNGHKVAFTPDQKQIIDPANTLRPTGGGGMYLDDRHIGPQSFITAAFSIPSKQLSVPAGVPAAALFELEDGRLVIIDHNGGNHYVSPLPAPQKEGWTEGLVRVFMGVASAYGGRNGGWAKAPGRPYPSVLEKTAPPSSSNRSQSPRTADDDPAISPNPRDTTVPARTSRGADNASGPRLEANAEVRVETKGQQLNGTDVNPPAAPPSGGVPTKPSVGPGGRAGESATGPEVMPTVRQLFGTPDNELLGIFQRGIAGEYGRPRPDEGWRLRLQIHHAEKGLYPGTGRPYVEFGGTIRDGAGNDVGRIQRLFTTDSDGDLIVEHAYLRLKKSVRGQGFSTELFNTMMKYYQRSGVTAITLHASLEDGGWAWAKAGFHWDNTGPQKEAANRASMLGQIREVRSNQNISKADQALLDDLQTRFSGPSERWPTPREMTDLGSEDPGLGERILRGSSWYGVRWL